MEAGSGGMAVVYRAIHLKLAKTVAIKVMSPNLANRPEVSAVSKARRG